MLETIKKWTIFVLDDEGENRLTQILRAARNIAPSISEVRSKRKIGLGSSLNLNKYFFLKISSVRLLVS